MKVTIELECNNSEDLLMLLSDVVKNVKRRAGDIDTYDEIPGTETFSESGNELGSWEMSVDKETYLHRD